MAETEVSEKWPREVVSYETADGKLHMSKTYADYWQGRLDGAARATTLLRQGASLYASLVEGGFLPVGIYLELDEVFASTKLVISHWQCRDEAGYQPRSIDADGGIWVGGHAGSWSGPYGATCSAVDVARYWATTKASVKP